MLIGHNLERHHLEPLVTPLKRAAQPVGAPYVNATLFMNDYLVLEFTRTCIFTVYQATRVDIIALDM